MRHAKRLAGLTALIAATYVAMPYVTLYRLGAAIRDGDAQALETLVDWDRVREGIKEDICDASADDPRTTTASAELPAFGESFLRGIAVNMIDQAVTAPALVKATQPPATGLVVARAGAAPDPQPRITWAFFESPTTFAVLLQPPGARAEPVRIELALHRGEWQVTRAWLPPEMMTPQADRT